MTAALPAWLLALALGASGCSGEGAADVPDQPGPTASEPLRVLLAGDSITIGYYATSPEQSFAALLLDAWSADHDVTAVRAEEAGARAWRIGRRIGEIAPEDLDVAVIEVGANDVGKTPVQEYAEDVAELVARVEEASPDVATVCLGPWNAPRAARRYDRVVRRLCDADGRRYVQVSDLYAADGMRGPVGATTSYGPRDDFHPNDLAHAEIARRVLAAVGD